MIQAPELCLGTVQFGLPYGVTNQLGQVPEPEVCRILELAATSGIKLLDTEAYGMAETVLGRCWPIASERRLIVSCRGSTKAELGESLTQLAAAEGIQACGFLLHRASDLLAADGMALLSGWRVCATEVL